MFLLLFIFQVTETSALTEIEITYDDQQSKLKNMYENKKVRMQSSDIISRGETAKVIVNGLGVSIESDFKLNALDVPISHPYFYEIRKLVELGVMKHVDYIHPDEPLKRSQVAAMIAIAFQVEVDQQNKNSFKDYQRNYWAKDYIESLADVGIIHGTSPTTFSPNKNVTRRQLTFLISRAQKFKDKVNNLEIIYDYLAKDYIHTTNDYIDWTNEMVKLVNIEREKVGLHPLKQDLALNQLAIIKAQDMVNRNYFEHKSSFYGNPWDMATLFDYQYTSLGENIARNFHSPQSVLVAWMESPSHRENILRQGYTNIGVGVKQDKKGNYYWVQMFSSN